jgi:endonuclease/exonuclease/phosphatase family metal-dependent hydrolase
MMTAIPPLTEAEKLEFGESTVGSPLETASSSLVIASYNIRYARGPHLVSGGLLRKTGWFKFQDRSKHIAKNIRTAAEALSLGELLPTVDVLALQEADKTTHRAGGHHVARELAAALKMTWVHAPAGIPRGIKPVQRQWWLDFEEPIDLHDPGDTGIAFLSRLQMDEVTRIDLPWLECPWRPRLAMTVTLHLGKRRIRLINVHVDPHAAADGQLEQLEVVADHARSTSDATIILGDFNTLSEKKCAATRKFLEARGYTSPLPTGTATWRGVGIRLHADWIFSRDVEIKRWGVARPLNVSDHWPIWAEVV